MSGFSNNVTDIYNKQASVISALMINAACEQILSNLKLLTHEKTIYQMALGNFTISHLCHDFRPCLCRSFTGEKTTKQAEPIATAIQ